MPEEVSMLNVTAAIQQLHMQLTTLNQPAIICHITLLKFS